MCGMFLRSFKTQSSLQFRVSVKVRIVVRVRVWFEIAINA